MKHIEHTFNNYPRQFWLLMGAGLIDMLGTWLLFPFYTLYFTHRFSAGMTQVGIIFSVYSAGTILGNLLGGALTDRFGRKKIVVLGLVMSATVSLTMVSLDNFRLMYILSALAGMFSSIGWPARQSMIADMLPEGQRTDGYAIARINLNIAAAAGPIVGGLLANYSFVYLFTLDALASVTTALIIVCALQETAPLILEKKSSETIVESFSGYRVVLRDLFFVIFLLVSLLPNIVYMQLHFSLPIFMRENLGFTSQQYGLLLAVNALVVIVLQFPITRWVASVPSMIMMLLGSLLYGAGFAIFGYTGTYSLFVVAVIIITFGEMIWAPTWYAILTQLAPEAYRGRYMAIGSTAMLIPGIFAPPLVGMVFDQFSANMIWQMGGIICLLAGLVYLLLHAHRSAQPAVQLPVTLSESY